ncbi:unnamed protein product [Blepharisma stoltei]|uniref:non-specific serine/threonine protein kinase n=1 Tax=Blepharisma stoltei TaxID=1481888 RepID=A0AAU9J321_9CILI|nr:unnamed protein product [Blepharisma stoltei]
MSQHSCLDNYIVLHKLGKGALSKVKAVRDPANGFTYAAKILKFPCEALSSRFREIVQNEMQSLKRLNHPNIISIFNANENGVYTKKNGDTYKCMYMIMELCPNGELFDILFQSGRFDERTSRFYFHQLIDGLEACHRAGVAHRDLKPENILFDENFNLKLTDFGFAFSDTGNNRSSCLQTNLKAENYMAPEILARQPYNGFSVDLFAAGIILFIMLSQNPPFNKATLTEPYYRLLSNKEERFWQLHSRNKPQNYYSAEFKSLITDMLAFNHSQRLTIEQIKAHPWYQGPVASTQEVGQELRIRRQKIFENAEKARELRQRTVGQRPGVGIPSNRFYRGDESDMGSLSLSFSIPPEDLIAKPLPLNFETVHKYFQLFTGLSPTEVMSIISHCLFEYNAECEVSQDYYEVLATVVTETDIVNFKVTVYDAGNFLTALSFDLLRGRKFDLMTIYRSIEGKIQEVQNCYSVL